MIRKFQKRIPKIVVFWAFNAAVGLFLVGFVINPAISYFSSREDVIAESLAQLTHFRAVERQTKSLMAAMPQNTDPFLARGEERVVSADLEANLKSIVVASGARFLSVRGLQSRRSLQAKRVAVALELEGTLPAIRAVLQVVEGERPFLFVTSAVIKSVSDSNEELIRTELTIEGAMHDQT